MNDFLLWFKLNFDLLPIGWDAVTATGTIISAIALSFTLFFLVRYTRATEKIAGYQLMPAVDVNMVYDRGIQRTYFWFSNGSNIPAFVSIEFKSNIRDKGRNFGPYRIPPNNSPGPIMKTATVFNFLPQNSTNNRNIKATLNINVTPAFNDNKINFSFTKSYKFNPSNLQWDEGSWGYPDPPFPTIS